MLLEWTGSLTHEGPGCGVASAGPGWKPGLVTEEPGCCRDSGTSLGPQGLNSLVLGPWLAAAPVVLG